MVKRRGSVQITFMIPEALRDQLKSLSERTRVSQAIYVREALEDLLKKYAVPSRPTSTEPKKKRARSA